MSLIDFSDKLKDLRIHSEKKFCEAVDVVLLRKTTIAKIMKNKVKIIKKKVFPKKIQERPGYFYLKNNFDNYILN